MTEKPYPLGGQEPKCQHCRYALDSKDGLYCTIKQIYFPLTVCRHWEREPGIEG